MLFSFPLKSLASEGSFLKYSVSASDKFATQKGLSFGYQEEILFLDVKWEAGFWADNSGRQGAKSSAFGSYSVGLEPTVGSFYVNFFQGVGLITHPDTVLGGPFQFFEDIGLGIRDLERGISIGLQYKHISSAGIFQPNLGRDTFGIQLMIPW
jgi:hypothetical protein